MKIESLISKNWRRAAPPLLLTLAYSGGAAAQLAPPLINFDPCSVEAHTTFRVRGGFSAPGSTAPYFRAETPSTWSATTAGVAGTACSGSGPWTCAGLTVTLPGAAEVVDTTYGYFFAGNGDTGQSPRVLKVTARRDASTACSFDFTFEATSSGGGWGDPHLTTVDGTHYDFQSAGEFTALREDGFEVQTRQSPVPTAAVPITNAYTEVTHCVAIYTAVAAKLGSSRVTVQPSPGAEPDPSSMQVRVDGNLVTLGNTPYVLYAKGNPKGVIDGMITKHPDGMYEITDARGTQLVVNSAYWTARKVWYLNVNVYGTSALQGTMGKLGDRSWLPSLPNGRSLGAKPELEADRYKVLYETFADAWRVTKETSLFDYKEYGAGVGTETYTLDEWPRFHPQSCEVDGQDSVKGTTEAIAQQACANVVDAIQKADCVFDVKVTGNQDFGKSYEVMQRFKPLPSSWYAPTSGTGSDCPACECKACKACKACKTDPPPPPPWWCCWIVTVFGLTQLALLVYLVLRARKKP